MKHPKPITGSINSSAKSPLRVAFYNPYSYNSLNDPDALPQPEDVITINVSDPSSSTKPSTATQKQKKHAHVAEEKSIATQSNCSCIQCKYTKQALILCYSLLAALPLGVNAFCAYTNTDTDKLSFDVIATWSIAAIIISCLNSLSSILVNTILNIYTTPFAVLRFIEFMSDCSHLMRNILFIFLATGAGIAAGEMGYKSFIELSVEFAWINFALSTLNYLVTRIYGLTSANNRYNLWKAHRFPGHFKTFIETLDSHLDNDLTDKLNQYIHNYIEQYIDQFHQRRTEKPDLDYTPLNVNETLVTEVLVLIRNEMITRPDCVSNLTKREIGWIVFDDMNGLVSGLAVALPFTIKFKQGIEQLTSKNDYSRYLMFLWGLLSIASPILYLGQAILTRSVLWDSSQEVRNSEHKFRDGLFYVLLLLANVAACSSLYNLQNGASKDKDYPLNPGVMIAIFLQFLAAFAAFCVNATITFKKAFLENKKHKKHLLIDVLAGDEPANEIPENPLPSTPVTPIHIPSSYKINKPQRTAKTLRGTNSARSEKSELKRSQSAPILEIPQLPQVPQPEYTVPDISDWLKQQSHTISHKNLNIIKSITSEVNKENIPPTATTFSSRIRHGVFGKTSINPTLKNQLLFNIEEGTGTASPPISPRINPNPQPT